MNVLTYSTKQDLRPGVQLCLHILWLEELFLKKKKSDMTLTSSYVFLVWLGGLGFEVPAAGE